MSNKNINFNEFNIRFRFSAFAKEDIPANEVITLYNGYIFAGEGIHAYNNKTKKDLQLEDLPPTDPKVWAVTKYHGSVPECRATITIPHYLGALSDYKASLGHKV